MPAAQHPTLLPATAAFPWPTLPVDPARLRSYLAACVARGVRYGLGRKADDAGLALTAFPPVYSEIDCSGWVRAALAFSSGVAPPDGSVTQQDWVRAHGFKRSRYLSLLARDGLLRVAFIAPNAARRVGHVYLCRDARTLESWGGHGPGSRSPLAHVLHACTTSVYVLTGPGGLEARRP